MAFHMLRRATGSILGQGLIQNSASSAIVSASQLGGVRFLAVPHLFRYPSLQLNETDKAYISPPLTGPDDPRIPEGWVLNVREKKKVISVEESWKKAEATLKPGEKLFGSPRPLFVVRDLKLNPRPEGSYAGVRAMPFIDVLPWDGAARRMTRRKKRFARRMEAKHTRDRIIKEQKLAAVARKAEKKQKLREAVAKLDEEHPPPYPGFYSSGSFDPFSDVKAVKKKNRKKRREHLRLDYEKKMAAKKLEAQKLAAKKKLEREASKVEVVYY